MPEPISIFHGYRLPEGTDLIGLAEKLRTVIAPVRDLLELQEVAGHVARIMDEADVAGQDRRPAVIFDAVQAHAEHVGMMLSGEHYHPLPTVTVAVGDDPETGRLYALTFLHHREFARALDDAGFGEWFPYWDEEDTGRDRPPGITTAEWTSRASVWERVLRGSSSEKAEGLFRISVGFTMPDVDMVNRAEDILAHIPDLDTRAVTALNTFAQGQVFASHEQFFHFQASIPQHLERLRAALKPITLEDLVGSGS